ncbi:UNVERIFIED_CONTAM: hypothetical protein FKN15_050649 [Acipenser sinensis]
MASDNNDSPSVALLDGLNDKLLRYPNTPAQFEAALLKWQAVFRHISINLQRKQCSTERERARFFSTEALQSHCKLELTFTVCKFKAHKRCAVRSTNNCKWTTLASIGNDIIEDEDGVAMPHQWLEGNLPVSAKCAVCDKTCGSVRRLQDCRCLWCKAIVHSACKEQFGKKCPLGPFRVSIIPPTALNSIDSDARVSLFYSLRLFQKFATFRILVCGGDGSVGWVLSELDKLGLHKQCQLGVLPLGTGNDLARVLGWGGLCDDDTQLLQILEKLERATTKMLDRWSILTYELPSKQPPPAIKQEENGDSVLQVQMTQYSDSVAFHLAKILDSDKHADVISSAKFLCGTVNEFVAEVGKAYERATENKEEADTMAKKASTTRSIRAPCALLNEKLDSLVKTLSEEADAVLVPTGSPVTPPTETSQGGNKEEDTLPRVFRSKDQLMLRANSLKKALRQIIEQAEKVVDEQNKHTRVYRMSSSSSMSLKKDNSEEFKEKEADALRRGTVSSTTSSIFLEKSDSFSSVHFTEDPNSIQCTEKCVMNNYFGIGLDAKISLEFNNKRDEHPKKCSSRTKNMMWYGVLGTKELLQKTYKNLEQRVQLECDGVPMSLPSLQGLAVLNIPSYAGGINFWGGTKEDNFFGAPSFDDKKLEVVAVFGSMQMAMSRVINLQHHRIAQCRSVKITILGDEGVPVQVDGEAWVQPPGILKIVHKNRAQMLTRDRAFESTLKSWEDKRKCDNYQGSRPRLNSQQSMEYLTEEEYSQLQQFGQAGDTLINKIREAAKTQKAIEQELAHPVNASALILNESFSNKASTPEQLESPQEEGLHSALNNLSNELQKIAEIHWIAHIINCTEEVSQGNTPY